jgi:hypothetical protein
LICFVLHCSVFTVNLPFLIVQPVPAAAAVAAAVGAPSPPPLPLEPPTAAVPSRTRLAR